MEGVEVRTTDELAAKASEAARRFNARFVWFRGHASSEWRLLPSVHRSYSRSREVDMLQLFRLLAPARYERCPPYEEGGHWLTLARHYGLPTRLLDWTESPLIAGFFAVCYEERPGPAVIWALAPGGLNQHQGLQPMVYQFSQEEIQGVLRGAFRRDEGADPRALGVMWQQMDPRMLAQQAAYTIHGAAEPLEDMEGCEEFLAKFVIPEESRWALSRQLAALGVRSRNLFPDLGALAQDIATSTPRTGQKPSPALIDAWRRQAESDLRNARRNAEIGAHDVCVLLCQQAAEEMLKAAYMAVRGEEAPRTHSLQALLNVLGGGPELGALGRQLTADYVTTRYPDIGTAPPSEAYTAEESCDRIDRAAKITDWARSLLHGDPADGH